MAGLGEALFTALSHKPENAVDLFLHLRLQSTLRDLSSLIKKKKKVSRKAAVSLSWWNACLACVKSWV